MDDEVVAQFNPEHPVRTTNDHDRWFETDIKALGNFVEKAKAELLDALKEKGANRKQRRMAAKIDLKKYLLESEGGRAVVDKIVENLNRDYALTGSIDRSVLDEYISGSKSRSRFEDYVRGLMFDPVSLISQLGPAIDIEKKLPTVVRNLGQDLMSKMNPQIDKLRSAIAEMPKTTVFEKVRGQIRGMPGDMMRRMRRNLIRDKINENGKLPADLTEDQLDELHVPILDVYADLLRRYISQAVSAAEAGAPARYFKLSDAADIFHALYVPHVDVFRCDSAWTNTLAPQGQRYSTDVVGKIEDLLPAIRRRLV